MIYRSAYLQSLRRKYAVVWLSSARRSINTIVNVNANTPVPLLKRTGLGLKPNTITPTQCTKIGQSKSYFLARPYTSIPNRFTRTSISTQVTLLNESHLYKPTLMTANRSQSQIRTFGTSPMSYRRATSSFFKASSAHLRSQLRNRNQERNGATQAKKLISNSGSNDAPLLLTAGNKRPLYNPAGGTTHYYADFQHSIHELDDAMKWRGYSLLRILFGLSALGTFYVYAFREEIKETASDVAADITSRTIENDELIEKAGALSQSVVLQVLTDVGTLEKSTEFITSLSGREDVKAAIVALLTLVLNDPTSIAKVKELLGAVVTQLLADPDLKQVFVDFAYWLITQETTTKALSQLMANTYKEPWFQETTNEFFGWVIASEPVYVASQTLMQNSMQATMADASFQEMTAVFFRDVLADQNLHEQGGNAMWEAFKFSLPGSGLFRRSPVATDDSGIDTDSIRRTRSDDVAAKSGNSGTKSNDSRTTSDSAERPSDNPEMKSDQSETKSDESRTTSDIAERPSNNSGTSPNHTGTSPNHTGTNPGESGTEQPATTAAIDEGRATDTRDVVKTHRSDGKRTAKARPQSVYTFDTDVAPEVVERRLRHDGVLPAKGKGAAKGNDRPSARGEGNGPGGGVGGHTRGLDKGLSETRTEFRGGAEGGQVGDGELNAAQQEHADAVALDEQIDIVNGEIGRKIESLATSESDGSDGDSGAGGHVTRSGAEARVSVLEAGRGGGEVVGSLGEKVESNTGRGSTVGTSGDQSAGASGTIHDGNTPDGGAYDSMTEVYDNPTKPAANPPPSESRRGAMLERINRRVRAQKDSFVNELQGREASNTRAAHIESLADALDEFHPVYDEHVMGGLLQGKGQTYVYMQAIGTDPDDYVVAQRSERDRDSSVDTIESIQRGVHASLYDTERGVLDDASDTHAEGTGKGATDGTDREAGAKAAPNPDSGTRTRTGEQTDQETTPSHVDTLSNTLVSDVPDAEENVEWVAEMEPPVQVRPPTRRESMRRTSRFWGWWPGGSSDATDDGQSEEPELVDEKEMEPKFPAEGVSKGSMHTANTDVPLSELSPRASVPVPRKK